MAALYKGKLQDGKTTFESYLNVANYTNYSRLTPTDQMKALQKVLFNSAFTYNEYHSQLNDKLWTYENGSVFNKSEKKSGLIRLLDSWIDSVKSKD